MRFTNSQELYKEGLKYLVGAVNSPVRSFNSVGGSPLFIKNAKGSKIQDVDGNIYIDYVLSYGAMILGHGHNKVNSALEKALKNGYSFGATSKGELILAKSICNVFPSMDKIRFVNSGTEAVLSAIRLARAYTGKSKIIKFHGCYHGHSDSLLVASGSGLATLSLPGSKGVPVEAVKNTLIAQYNNLDHVKAHFQRDDNIAGVIIEPVAGNMGVVLPEDGFLYELKSFLEKKGGLLIADEVMTGFRSCFSGAQSSLGIEADITCLGKVIGGGLPVGAYGARDEIMRMVAPLGKMYQAGTLSGNPITMAAGIATLDVLKQENPYPRLDKMSQEIEKTLIDAARISGVQIRINRFGSMINPFFTSEKVTDFSKVQTCDTKKYAVFFWEMIKQGVFIPPSQYEAWFLCTALSEKDLEKTSKAIYIAMDKVKSIKYKTPTTN